MVTLACIYGSLLAAAPNGEVDLAMAKVFHSWWFLALMGLLALNLVLCSWEKSLIAVTLYWRRHFLNDAKRFHTLPYAVEINGEVSDKLIQETLSKKFFLVHHEGNAWYAQKGLVGRCGATIIHLGLLWTMAAGLYRIYADDFGWGIFDATIIIPEGQTTDAYYTRIDRLQKPVASNLREHRLPFRLRALDFRADYYPNSTVARSFSSLVEIRDNEHAEIVEISMAHPLTYHGMKITQNSFSENPQVVRGAYTLFDRTTGQTYDLDAAPNDPIRIPIPEEPSLFFQTDSIEDGHHYQIVDLSRGVVIQEGMAQLLPTAPTLQELERQIRQTRYAMVIPALFPNLRLEADGTPTTENDKFENPAALVMLYKGGKPNGSLWLFLRQDAQEVMGQPHPEIEAYFRSYRSRTGSGVVSSLFDVEVLIELRQRQPETNLGQFWIRPGTVFEIPGIAESLLATPNVTPKPIASRTSATSPSTTWTQRDEVLTTAGHVDTSVSSALAASSLSILADHAMPLAGANDRESSAPYLNSAQLGTNNSPNSRFEVIYRGKRSGHVTYLGLRKDPSIMWIYAGCLTIFSGTLVAFLISYREVWVLRDTNTGKVYLGMAVRRRGLSNISREFEWITRTLTTNHQKTASSRGFGHASEAIHG